MIPFEEDEPDLTRILHLIRGRTGREKSGKSCCMASICLPGTDGDGSVKLGALDGRKPNAVFWVRDHIRCPCVPRILTGKRPVATPRAVCFSDAIFCLRIVWMSNATSDAPARER